MGQDIGVDPNTVAEIWHNKYSAEVQNSVLLSAGITQLQFQVTQLEAQLEQVTEERDELKAAAVGAPPAEPSDN